MYQQGTFYVSISTDNDGNRNANVAFQPAGGGELIDLGGPFDLSSDGVIVIDPSCIQCDLQTGASWGQSPPAGAGKRPAKAPAPPRPVRPAVPPGPVGPRGESGPVAPH